MLNSRPSTLFAVPLLILQILVSISLAQESPTPTDSARMALDQYFSACREGDWYSCATMMHPRELGKLKGLMATVIDVLRDAKDDPTPFISAFDGAETLDDVLALDSLKFYDGFLTWLTSMFPSIATAMTNMNMKIIGVLDEPPNRRLFVYRTTFPMEGETYSETDVVVTEKYEGHWCILMEESIDNFVNMFNRVKASSLSGSKP